MVAMDSTNRVLLLQRGRYLEIFTVLWSSAEALVGIVLGILAGSVALIGFGADSFIEMGSGLVLLWRLQTKSNAPSAERAEAVALRLVGLSLLVLAVYIVYDSVKDLVRHHAPEASPAGIVLALVALIVMPVLARKKRQVAAGLHSHALEADALQASICAYLSAFLLVGLALNAALGWWWADPLAAIGMTPIIVREGARALRGERCEECA